MIDKITIKSVASYDAIGVIIENLKKVNFLFGHNGSGKSTIAKYLRDVSILDPTAKNMNFNNCSQNGYNPAKHELLVFNDQFVNDNFITKGKLKGVFSLDQINEKIQTQIDNNDSKIKAIDKRITQIEGLIEKIENRRSQYHNDTVYFCYEQRRRFEFMRHKATDLLLHRKEAHYDKIKQYISQLGSVEISSFDTIQEEFSKYYEHDITIIPNVNIKLYLECRRMDRSLSMLLDSIIVGNKDVKIATLVEKLNNRRWVEEGVGFLELTDGICPFCQNGTITKELINDFELLFDEEYKEKLNRIQRFKDIYTKVIAQFKDSLISIRTRYNSDGVVQNIIDTIDSIIKQNIENIESKLDYPNQKFSFIELSKVKLDLSSLLKKINTNNSDYNELEQKRSEVKNAVWLFMANECTDSIAKLEEWYHKAASTKGLAGAHMTYFHGINQRIVAQNSQLMNQTANTDAAVENINQCLIHAGFSGFEIKEHKEVNNIKYYCLHRDGVDGKTKNLFSTLSEGEKNFISFLYFYQLCIGTDDYENNKSKKKIIVIDDPVSSMDSQVLFIISTLIHQLIKYKSKESRSERAEFKNPHIQQVIILTHNMYFYKEVSLSMRPICTNRMHYRVVKLNKTTTIERYENSIATDDYLLIWEKLKEIKYNLPKDKSQNIQIANMMRRVLDSYVSFVGVGNDCWGAIVDDPNEPHYIIKSAFISSINDSSHKISPFDGVYFQKITNEEPLILFDVFSSIFKEIGKEHYEMHMGKEESKVQKSNNTLAVTYLK